MTLAEQMALAELEWELSAPHTLEEIAAHLGVSRRTVRRVEARALEKIKGLLIGGQWEDGGLREPPLLSQRRAEDYVDSTGMTPRRKPAP